MRDPKKQRAFEIQLANELLNMQATQGISLDPLSLRNLNTIIVEGGGGGYTVMLVPHTSAVLVRVRES